MRRSGNPSSARRGEALQLTAYLHPVAGVVEDGGNGQSDNQPHPQARCPHGGVEGQQVADRQGQQQVGEEGDAHDALHVLDAAQDGDRVGLQAVGDLEDGHEDEEVGGHLHDGGVGGEQQRDLAAQGDEQQGRDDVPHQSQPVGGAGIAAYLGPVAAAVGVADADRDARTDAQDDHEGEVGDDHGDLVAGQFAGADPSHHDAGQGEGAALHEHLQGDGRADPDERTDRLPREVVAAEEPEVAVETVAPPEVEDDEDRGENARDQRGESGSGYIED